MIYYESFSTIFANCMWYKYVCAGKCSAVGQCDLVCNKASEQNKTDISAHTKQSKQKR